MDHRKRDASGAAGKPQVDHDRLLQLVGEAHAVLDLDDFRWALLELLGRAVPADWISLNDVGADAASTVAIVEPELSPEWHELFARLASQHPIVKHVEATGEGRAVRFSDILTADELHALPIYTELYSRLGIEHQIAFTLPRAPNRMLAIALSRREHDFSDEERDLLNRARPYLIQAYRNAAVHTRLQAEVARRPETTPVAPAATALAELGLSVRQAEVLRLVSMGRSNNAVALQLGLSPRTVQKHLEHCYRKLGVRDRSHAASIVWRGGPADTT